mmetsp:Transcript_12217/g.29011  ORF Transcript_12217/g.29011 Transcript_12217/m.29011 type:complete len:112 (+) Transcript_12217:899-1234(+)
MNRIISFGSKLSEDVSRNLFWNRCHGDQKSGGRGNTRVVSADSIRFVSRWMNVEVSRDVRRWLSNTVARRPAWSSSARVGSSRRGFRWMPAQKKERARSFSNSFQKEATCA